ncbi:MAG: sulfatase [Bacteroidales bacterium]|nr:sulfatase [Bacteroidales bacterium]
MLGSRFLGLVAWAVAGWLSFAATSAAVDPQPRPNIVFLIGDDQSWKDYGFMGHPFIQTPHLDKLASESLVFPQGYVPTSLCRASLATMITGLYPHQHKITSNDPPLPPGKNGATAMQDEGYLRMRAEMVAEFNKSPTLPKLLTPVGYVSHQSGKWWEGNACRCGGFTEAMTIGDPRRGGRHGDVGLTIGRQGLQPVFTFIDESRKAGKPFYLWYAPIMPHQPHNPPERLLKKYRDKTPSVHVAKYWAMCEWFDETIGEVLAHLDKRGLRQNTLVVYLHDNGWIQDPNAPKYAPKSKRSPYDGGTRTPIMIRWPGHITPARSDHFATSLDLLPTVLTAIGKKPTPDLPGLNLLDTQAVGKRDTVYGEIFEHNAVDIHDPAANLQYRWVIHGHWKLIVPQAPNVQNGSVELYDLAQDPDETRNLAAAHPDRVAALRKRLDAWWSPGK